MNSADRRREKLLTDLYSRARKETEPLAQALAGITFPIIQASKNCVVSLKKLHIIAGPTDFEELRQESLVFWECVCFYVYTMLKLALRKMTGPQINTLRTFLDGDFPGLVVAVTPSCDRWSNNAKEEMTKSLRTTMQKMQLIYEEKDFDDIFEKLALFILVHCGASDPNTSDPRVEIIAGQAAYEFEQMRLETLLIELGRKL